MIWRGWRLRVNQLLLFLKRHRRSPRCHKNRRLFARKRRRQKRLPKYWRQSQTSGRVECSRPEIRLFAQTNSWNRVKRNGRKYPKVHSSNWRKHQNSSFRFIRSITCCSTWIWACFGTKKTYFVPGISIKVHDCLIIRTNSIKANRKTPRELFLSKSGKCFLDWLSLLFLVLF